VFGELFLPDAEPLVGTLLAFATYAVGFVARPVGGVIAGHFGDRAGRRSVLVATLLVMGLATLALLAAVLTDDAFSAWGWRIPFLLSGVLVLVGLWIRGRARVPARAGDRVRRPDRHRARCSSGRRCSCS
jgi:MFS family permease